MRFLPLSLLFACSPYVDSYAQQGHAWCDKYFECSDEMEDYIEGANWDGAGECHGDVDDAVREGYEQEEAVACYDKYCEVDQGNLADCVASIHEIDCDELEDGDYETDCDSDDIYDCDDEDDLADCLEDAAKNEYE